MKVKNVSKKIINVGNVILLPNEIATVPEDFVKNTGLSAIVEMDFLTIVKEKATEEQTEEVKTGVPENLDKMKRAELVEICEKNGIEVTDDDTKAMLCEKIREVLA